LELKIVKRLLDTGVSLQQIRTAVEHLRARGTTDLTQVTLMSDGVSVYECTSPDEVIDLLAGGQGVFGIAIGRVWQEIEGSLSQLPSDQSEYAVAESDISDSVTSGNDELSMRRRARVAGE
jgi:DNA-binding transcriptional MerR regulator